MIRRDFRCEGNAGVPESVQRVRWWALVRVRQCWLTSINFILRLLLGEAGSNIVAAGAAMLLLLVISVCICGGL